MTQSPEVEELIKRLAAPFTPAQIKFKPQSVNKEKTRALALAYIDGHAVKGRLDEAVGVAGWQDSYEVLDDRSVKCTLRVKIGDEWITKEDAGGASDQEDKGDRMKAAFTDALKRAAVKFGIGRFLYELPKNWWPYDPVKKTFVGTPNLPASFYPDGKIPRQQQAPQQQQQQGGGNPPPAQAAAPPPAANPKPPASAPAVKTPDAPPDKPPSAPKPTVTVPAAAGTGGGNPTPAPAQAKPRVQAQRAATAQLDEINNLCGDLRYDLPWLQNALMEKFGKQEPADLTALEADVVLKGLKLALSKKGGAPTATAPKKSGF
jgi:hypothetical protein